MNNSGRGQERVIKSVVSLVAGALLGMIIAVVVDNALLEISVSRLFAVVRHGDARADCARLRRPPHTRTRHARRSRPPGTVD